MSTCRVGERPSAKTRQLLRTKKLFKHVEGHLARVVTSEDFEIFDHILAVDEESAK